MGFSNILIIICCYLVPKLCLTLLWPHGPDSSVHGIFSGKNDGVGCHFLLHLMIILKPVMFSLFLVVLSVKRLQSHFNCFETHSCKLLENWVILPFHFFLIGNSAPSSVCEICCPRCEWCSRLGVGSASGTKEKTKVSEISHPPSW